MSKQSTMTKPFKALLQKVKSFPLLMWWDTSPSAPVGDVKELPCHCPTDEEWQRLAAELEQFLDLALCEAVNREWATIQGNEFILEVTVVFFRFVTLLASGRFTNLPITSHRSFTFSTPLGTKDWPSTKDYSILINSAKVDYLKIPPQLV